MIHAQILRRSIMVLIAGVLLTLQAPVEAAWIWTPDVGKWVNPKKAVKDTAEDQFDWALEFFHRHEWDRALGEFEKVPENYPTSRLSAESVYYIAQCWKEKQDLAKTGEAFQRLTDRYPYSDRIKDAIKGEFDIANELAKGVKLKVLGVPALPGEEKALELYKHVVKNAPFGTYGDQAQFKIGELYKKQGDYEEAQKAFQAVVDEYPASPFVGQARFEIANASMLASQKSQYDEQHAERAIEQFEGFKNTYPVDAKSVEADESIKALRLQKAKTAYDIGSFYEKQGKWPSARVYYLEVAAKYGDTALAASAKKKAEEMMQKQNEPPKKPEKKFWIV